MISLGPGIRTTLSGSETKSMTHYLRRHHDAILVGSATFAADDPSLNCRYPDTTLEMQPRPILLLSDDRLRQRLPISKVQTLANEGKGLHPWIVGRDIALESDSATWNGNSVTIGSNESGRIQWSALFSALQGKGIGSVMVEGGANVINSLLAEPEVVDSVIVTIAPTFLGRGGVQVAPEAKGETADGQRSAVASMRDVKWQQFGQDVVCCGRSS